MTATAGTVTFLFTDLVGSTEILDQLGDDAAVALSHAHFALLRDAVVAHGGQEVKSLGDGLMVAFPSALNAVAAAVAMQQAIDRHNRREDGPALGVRVGLHAGEPVRSADDYFGTAVVIARRLCDMAQGGEVLLSAVVRGLVGSRGGFAFSDLGLLALKGLSEPVGAYAVAWQSLPEDLSAETTPAADPPPEAPIITSLPLAAGSPLVGRGRELDTLRQALAAAATAEQRRFILLAGEPGVGKTRLLLEAAALAQAGGWRVLVGHAYDSEGMPPYLPFIEALQDYVHACPIDTLRAQLGEGAADVALLLPEIGRRLPRLPSRGQGDPENERYRLFEAVCGLLLAIARAGSPASPAGPGGSMRTNGLLLCLDDLHWADDSTLLLLEHLARRLSDAPLLILATYRDTDLEVGRPFARTLEQLTRRRLSQRLDIKRLDRDEVAALLAALARPEPPARLVDAVYGETEGNPFFVQEVFEYLAGEGRLFDAEGGWRADLHVSETDVPQGVRLVIGRRLERLSEECRRVLSMASVLGRNFSFELLRTVAGPSTGSGQGLDEDSLIAALDEAERAQLLASGARGQLTFAHELIRQTLLTSLSALRRQRLHLSAGQAIEKLDGDQANRHAADLAGHFFEAGGDPASLAKALQYAELAAEQATAIYAWGEAVRRFEQALQVEEALDPEDKAKRCDLLQAVSEALIMDGQTMRVAEEEAERAFSLAEALGDNQRASIICRLVQQALVSYETRLMAGTPLYRRWAERADRHAAVGDVARVYADLGLSAVLLEDGQLLQSAGLRRQALALARTLGDHEALFWAVCNHLWVPLPAQDEPELLDLAREFATASRGGASFVTYAQLLIPCALRLLEAGEKEPAEALLLRAVEIADLTHNSNLMLNQYWIRILLQTLNGRLDEAVAAKDELLARSQEIGRPIYGRAFALYANRALIALGRADEALASQRLSRRMSGLPEGIQPGGSLLAYSGQIEQARELLRGTMDRLGPSLPEIATSGLCGLLETAVLVGDKAAAASLVEPLRSLSGMLALTPSNISMARLLGDAAVLLGRPEEARADYEQGLEVCARISFRPEIALIRLSLAELLRQRFPAEHALAEEHLDFAIAEFQAMGMTPALGRARTLRP